MEEDVQLMVDHREAGMQVFESGFVCLERRRWGIFGRVLFFCPVPTTIILVPLSTLFGSIVGGDRIVVFGCGGIFQMVGVMVLHCVLPSFVVIVGIFVVLLVLWVLPVAGGLNLLAFLQFVDDERFRFERVWILSRGGCKAKEVAMRKMDLPVWSIFKHREGYEVNVYLVGLEANGVVNLNFERPCCLLDLDMRELTKIAVVEVARGKRELINMVMVLERHGSVIEEGSQGSSSTILANCENQAVKLANSVYARQTNVMLWVLRKPHLQITAPSFRTRGSELEFSLPLFVSFGVLRPYSTTLVAWVGRCEDDAI
jgi:hypothetical protein